MLNALSYNNFSETVLLHKPSHAETKLFPIRFDKYIVNPLFL